ncbi:MAG: hypothetical protein QOG38_3435, partial [Hyphomicrobiales bacterium]|nr:hypothetical protein [Hyphomicrobiales bacterium]
MSDPAANPPDTTPPAGSPEQAPAAPAMSAAAAVAAMEARSAADAASAMPAATSVPAVAPADPFTAPAAPPDEPAPPPHGCFLGSARTFWRLLARGAALLFVTLGLYRFWLATDIRRFLWSNSEIAGDSLEYIGTARELLLGFLIAIALLVPINMLFFLGAFAKGAVGQLSGTVAFVALALLGQFAVYRARRYRLTRTVYRGLRFHQTGSAWRYAVCALFWWGMIAITLGLAYPFAQASLERFKVGHTFYGDLRGRFEGSGFGLFFRGLLMWLLVMVPLLFGIVAAIGAVDWTALGEAMKRSSDDPTKWLDEAQIGSAAALAALGIGWSILAAAALYPLFQAMVLRWWISGLRFGALTVRSRLRTGSVYGLYMRFVWYAFLAGLALSAVGTVALLVIGMSESL